MPYNTDTASPAGLVVTVTGVAGEPVKNCARLPRVIVAGWGAITQVPFTCVTLKLAAPLTEGITFPFPIAGPTEAGLSTQVTPAV